MNELWSYPVYPFLNTALASIDISPSALSQHLRRAAVVGQDIDAIAKEDDTVRRRPDGCEHGLNPAGYYVLLQQRQSLEIDVDLTSFIRIGTTRVSEADHYSFPISGTLIGYRATWWNHGRGLAPQTAKCPDFKRHGAG